MIVIVTITTGAVPVGAFVGTADGAAEGDTTGAFVGEDVRDVDACTLFTTTYIMLDVRPSIADLRLLANVESDVTALVDPTPANDSTTLVRV